MGRQGIRQALAPLVAAGILGSCLTGWATAAPPDPASSQAARAALNLADRAPLDMAHWTGSYAYLQGELRGASFQAVRMPYEAGRRSLLIVLPDASVNFGRFVAAVTTEELKHWSGQLRASFGSISLPKAARADGSPARTTPLASLGIGASEAAFAAAGPPFTMTVDHPFFYAIEDNKTHELLFVGVLMDPT